MRRHLLLALQLLGLGLMSCPQAGAWLGWWTPAEARASWIVGPLIVAGGVLIIVAALLRRQNASRRRSPALGTAAVREAR
jgi:hypothetical protein